MQSVRIGKELLASFSDSAGAIQMLFLSFLVCVL